MPVRQLYNPRARSMEGVDLGRLDALQAIFDAQTPKLPRQRYDDELVVYVWPNGNVINGPCGHAALKVHARPGGVAEKHYISWWPGDGANGSVFEGRVAGQAQSHQQDKYFEMGWETRDQLVAGNYAPRAGQQLRETTLTSNQGGGRYYDYFTFEQAPSHKVTLAGAESQPFGLFTLAAWEWFEGFCANDGQYAFASRHHNCAGVVRTALKEAGAEAFAEAPPVSGWASPNEVQGWATQLAGKIDRLNQRAAMFRQRTPLQGTSPEVALLLPMGTLPSVNQWQGLTRGNRGHRGQNVRALDGPLGRLGAEQGRLNQGKAHRVTYLKALIEAFGVIERAVLDKGHHRTQRDKQKLTALGHRLLGFG